MKSAYVLPLADFSVGLETVGGKGLSLLKMINEGLPVPDGFHITTEAYRAFVEANHFQTKTLAALKGMDTSQTITVDGGAEIVSLN